MLALCYPARVFAVCQAMVLACPYRVGSHHLPRCVRPSHGLGHSVGTPHAMWGAFHRPTVSILPPGGCSRACRPPQGIPALATTVNRPPARGVQTTHHKAVREGLPSKKQRAVDGPQFSISCRTRCGICLTSAGPLNVACHGAATSFWRIESRGRALARHRKVG